MKMMTATTYATIDNTSTITALHGAETDGAAQAWYRTGVHSAGRFVVLDLGADEQVHVGDRVTVDQDGVSTLQEERS
jgi:hypothetical protein